VSGRWQIIESDVLDALRTVPDASFDAILTDCPYGLGTRDPSVDELVAYLRGESGLDTGGDFMAKAWEIPPVSVWREAVRVLRSGAPVLAFSGTRTQDLISIGMRAGGLEIRDAIDWVHAQGMSKSLDVSRAISVSLCTLPGRHFMSTLPPEKKRQDGDHLCPDHEDGLRFDGQGTSVKPTREPIILARVPPDGSVAENALKHGVGGLNIDGTRIATKDDLNGGAYYGERRATDAPYSMPGARPFQMLANGCGGPFEQPTGRFPKNLLLGHADGCRHVGSTRVRGAHQPGVSPAFYQNERGVYGKYAGNRPTGYVDADGLEECEEWSCVPGCPVAEMDWQSGDRPGMSGGGVHREDYGGGMFGGIDSRGTAYADDGGAARFFFCSKASRGEREFGCGLLPARSGSEAVGREEGSAGCGPRAGAGRSAKAIRNIGPCVKPLDLTTYLAKLVLPPPRRDGRPRRLLVPYCGTGSEMIGGLRAGWDEVVGIQRTSDDDEHAYVAIARARITRWLEVPEQMDVGEALSAAEKPTADARQPSLFDHAGGLR
jgi:site-specific DNA-methyltransferase (adenine-specific)